MFLLEKLSYSRLLFVVLVFICILPINCLNAQEEDKFMHVLFGLPFNNCEVKSLLVEVEQKFGKQVREEWLDEKDPMSGKSNVGDDGTPIIWINPAHGRKIDVIVHELYHFKLRDQGYPVLKWLIPNYMNNDTNRAAFHQLAEQLHDPILHYIFYSKVRAWGINPGETFEKRTKQSLKDNTLSNTFTNMDKEAIGLYYFKVRLEVNDPVLFQELIELLEHKQKQSGIDFGKKLTQIVINANPRSPEANIQALMNCLNTLYEGKFSFKQHPWTSRELGKHTQHVAQIEVVPLR